MPAIVLTPEERRNLRAQAHHLKPVVMVGQEGLMPSVMQEAEVALKAHGLIKVRVFSDDKAVRDEFLQRMAETLNAGVVQHIGKLLVLWRPVDTGDTAKEAKEPKAAGHSGPKEVKILKYSKRGGQRPEVRRFKVLGNQRMTKNGILKRADVKQVSVKKRSLG